MRERVSSSHFGSRSEISIRFLPDKPLSSQPTWTVDTQPAQGLTAVGGKIHDLLYDQDLRPHGEQTPSSAKQRNPPEVGA